MPRKITSHREMAHVLGLEDNPHDKKVENTGWNVDQAVESTNERYNSLKSKYNSKLNFYALSSSSSEQIAEDISQLKSGDYVGFGARWTGHAYTLHAVKERDQTHFIYVNRGWRHDSDSINDELSSSNAESVMVFTKSNEEADKSNQ